MESVSGFTFPVIVLTCCRCLGKALNALKRPQGCSASRYGNLCLISFHVLCRENTCVRGLELMARSGSELADNAPATHNLEYLRPGVLTIQPIFRPILRCGGTKIPFSSGFPLVAALRYLSTGIVLKFWACQTLIVRRFSLVCRRYDMIMRRSFFYYT